MQSFRIAIRGEGDPEDRTTRLMSEHELDQELLYIMWRAGKVTEDLVQSWAMALSELEKESPCEYFLWLLKLNPQLIGAFEWAPRQSFYNKTFTCLLRRQHQQQSWISQK